VNTAELHRFSVYGSLARLVYPGTFACCTHPTVSAAINDNNTIAAERPYPPLRLVFTLKEKSRSIN
jgi:hypothetical protein